MRHKLIIPMLMLFPLFMACLSTTAPPLSSAIPSIEPTSTGLDMHARDTYYAVFEIHFAGTYSWVYRLESRSDGHVTSFSCPENQARCTTSGGSLARISRTSLLGRYRRGGCDSARALSRDRGRCRPSHPALARRCRRQGRRTRRVGQRRRIWIAAIG